jgi:uroporphyrinogen III methyltransferase / synthase
LTADKNKPLAGKRVLVTRAREQSGELLQALTEAGAEPVLFPVMGFCAPANRAPFDEALRSLEQFDWLIFTSQNAVQAFSERAAELGIPLPARAAENAAASGRSGTRIAAVGPTTASAASRAGLRVDYVAREFRGAALAAELGKQLAGKKVLLPRSDRAGEDLPAALRAQMADVTEVIAYSTGMAKPLDASGLDMLCRGEVDVAAFFSPSAFHNLAEIVGLEALRNLSGKLMLAAIGPVTAAAIQEAGLKVDIVAAQASAKALVAAIEEHFLSKRRPGVSTA